VFDRSDFVAHAHLAAASALFVGLIVVAGANFLAFRAAKPGSRNPYALLALLLLVSGVGIGAFHLIDKYGTHWNWTHWLFWLEASVIAEFIGYWIVQSVHLWETETPSALWAATLESTSPETGAVAP
jgi:hypothetical protein